jgi:hypothetical protein
LRPVTVELCQSHYANLVLTPKEATRRESSNSASRM